MRTARLMVVSLVMLSVSLISCTRKMSDSSRVGVSLKNLMKSSKVSSLTYDKISHVVINVSGPGMPGPVVVNWDGHRNGTVITSPDYFELTVPKGDNRLIQILVVASDSTSGADTFLYGDQLKSIQNAEESADVTATKVGTGTGVQAHVAGRFLTSNAPDAGPTGELELLFQPPVTGRPPMSIMDVPMINGWFQLFLVDGAQFSYRFRHNGEVLFSSVDYNNAAFAPSGKVLHVIQPSGTGYWGGSDVEARPEEHFIVGYFGPSSASGTHYACYNSTAGTVSNLYSDAYPAHTTLMQYDPTQTATTYIRRLSNMGGFASNVTQCTSGSTAYSSRIDFDGKNLGSGKAKSFGFESIFQVTGGSYSSIATSYSAGNLNMSWSYVSSDVIGAAGVDGVAVLVSKTGFNGDLGMGSDGTNCAALLRDQAATGFYLAGVTTGTSFSVPMTSAESNQALVAVCPYKDNYLGQPRHYFAGGRSENNGGGGGGGASGPAAEVGFRQGSMVVNAGACAELDVVLLNSSHTYSDPSLNTGAVTVNLSSSGAPVNFLDGGCSGSMVTSVTVAASTNSKRVGIQSPGTAGSVTLTALSTGSSLPAEAGAGAFVVAPSGDVTVVNFNDDTGQNFSAIPVNVCMGVRLDFYSNIGTSMTSAAMNVSLSGSPGVSYYSDGTCMTPITSMSVTSGSYSSNPFYVKVAQAGWANLMANYSGYTPSSGPTYNLSANYGVPAGVAGTALAFDFTIGSIPSPLGTGNCTQVTLSTVDAYGTPTNVASTMSPITVGINGLPGDYYTESTCTTLLTGGQVSITGGTSSVVFYIKPTSSYVTGSYLSASFGSGSNYWSGREMVPGF